MARVFKIAVRNTLARFGLMVRRRCPSIAADEYPLAPDLPMLIAQYMSKSPIDRRPLRFVYIGANDGVTGDDLLEVAKDRGMQGVLVEPLPDLFYRLSQRYGTTSGWNFVNSAIAERAGNLTLYRVRADAIVPDWAHGLASFDRRHLMKHARHFGGKGTNDINGLIEKVEVRAMTFPDLMKESGLDGFEILVIDTEGMDAKILELANVERYLPAIIKFESMHLSINEWEQSCKLLKRLGYAIVSTLGDTIAYRKPV